MASEAERRASPRITPKRTMWVDYPDWRPDVRNISLSGAFIKDPRPLPPGRNLKLKLWLGYQEPVTITAVVRRVEEGRGMGVEFLSMSETDGNRLREFVGTAPPWGP